MFLGGRTTSKTIAFSTSSTECLTNDVGYITNIQDGGTIIWTRIFHGSPPTETIL